MSSDFSCNKRRIGRGLYVQKEAVGDTFLRRQLSLRSNYYTDKSSFCKAIRAMEVRFVWYGSFHLIH